MHARQAFYQLSCPQRLAFIRQKNARPYWERKYIKSSMGFPKYRKGGLFWNPTVYQPGNLNKYLKPRSLFPSSTMGICYSYISVTPKSLVTKIWAPGHASIGKWCNLQEERSSKRKLSQWGTSLKVTLPPWPHLGFCLHPAKLALPHSPQHDVLLLYSPKQQEQLTQMETSEVMNQHKHFLFVS